MICTWTGSYLYTPETANGSILDTVCNSILRYAENPASRFKLNVTTKEVHNEWYLHGKSITVKRYYVQTADGIISVEELADHILAYYEGDLEYLSNDNEGVYIGKPYSPEDIDYFVNEIMLEFMD